MSSIGLQDNPSSADTGRMLQTSYSWRPLGELLVENGSLALSELETALAEQRRSGRLLGEILVESDYVSAFTLARALAAQHGVELAPTSSMQLGTTRATDAPPNPGSAAWRPLGKLL